MAKKIFLNPMPARPTDEILGEIRDIYFKTNRSTILSDFARAIDLLKSIPTPEERQRATVYMDGLAEMRKEFGAAAQMSGRSGRARNKRKPRRSNGHR